MQQRDYETATAFGQRVIDAAGAAVTGVVAYGSRARGDHRPDSDLDLAIIVRTPADVPHVREILRPLERGNIVPQILTAADFERVAAFVDNVRRDAVPVGGDAAFLLAKPYSASPWDVSRDEIELARVKLELVNQYDPDQFPEAVRHASYYTLFRLARALLFARTGTAPYRHKQAREELARLAHVEPEWAEFALDLASAAAAREADDYGPAGADRPSGADARVAREAALRWFEAVKRALGAR